MSTIPSDQPRSRPWHRGIIKTRKGPPYSVYGFPEVISTHAASRRKAVEIYTRALLLEGHGYPVYFPYGKLNPPDQSVLKPVSIGDVGVVSAGGHFKWLFNIFLPADKPTQVHLPDDFQPFEPAPSSSEIAFTPEFHKPGTVLTSPGVNVDIRSREPWDVHCTSEEGQAGVLILQGGADRYDLISTERYHDYIAKNAIGWYEAANNYTSAAYPNGSLIVVTGYDSCKRFSHTQYCPEPGGQTTMDITFTERLGSPPGYWENSKGYHNHEAVGWPCRPQSGLTVVEGPLTVFVRGIRVSLNGNIWRSIFPPNGFAPKNLHCTIVAAPASKTQLWLEETKVKLKIGRTQEDMLQDFLTLHESTFQPNFLIGQILIGQYPQASVVLVEDQIWSSHIEKGQPCTLLELNKLLTRMFAACHIIEYRGIIKLVPKQQDTLRQRFPGERILNPPPSWARRKAGDDWVRHVPLAKWPWL